MKTIKVKGQKAIVPENRNEFIGMIVGILWDDGFSDSICRQVHEALREYYVKRDGRPLTHKFTKSKI